MADSQIPDWLAQSDNPDGRLVDALKSTWKPTDPVKLQSIDQMLSGDASGKEFNPTENGYKWNGAGFVNPNGSTISVNPDGSVSQATPAYKDYEFNGQYWNPAGENIAWHPDTNTSAYKINGVEVPINRENMKGIAAYTDANGKPQMQINKEGIPVFTEPEGTRFTGDWVNTYAPYITSAVLGGTTAAAAGAFGAGTTLAGEAAASGASAWPGVSSADLGTTATNVASNTVPYSNIGISSADLGTTGTNVAYDGAINNAAPYAGDSKYAAQDVMQQSRDVTASGGPTAWDAGKTGLSNAGKAMLLSKALSGFNKQPAQTVAGGGSYGGGGGWNYQNQPFLSNQQQPDIFAKTGSNVSGYSPPSLDITRSNNLMANLIRNG